MKGTCYWFFANNKTDHHGIHYCHYGSLCRFHHLTQEEVQLVRDGGSTPCHGCHGTGEQTIQVFGNPAKISCIICDGAMVLSAKKAVLEKAHNRDWCRCKTDTDSTYYPDNTHPKCRKHCYVCVRCKGITQIG